MEATRTSSDASAPLPYAGRDVLSALRLVARGFSPVEVAAQQRCSMADVLRDLHGALVALRAPTLRAAITEATRRGLID